MHFAQYFALACIVVSVAALIVITWVLVRRRRVPEVDEGTRKGRGFSPVSRASVRPCATPLPCEQPPAAIPVAYSANSGPIPTAELAHPAAIPLVGQASTKATPVVEDLYPAAIPVAAIEEEQGTAVDGNNARPAPEGN